MFEGIKARFHPLRSGIVLQAPPAPPPLRERSVPGVSSVLLLWTEETPSLVEGFLVSFRPSPARLWERFLTRVEGPGARC